MVSLINLTKFNIDEIIEKQPFEYFDFIPKSINPDSYRILLIDKDKLKLELLNEIAANKIIIADDKKTLLKKIKTINFENYQVQNLKLSDLDKLDNLDSEYSSLKKKYSNQLCSLKNQNNHLFKLNKHMLIFIKRLNYFSEISTIEEFLIVFNNLIKQINKSIVCTIMQDKVNMQNLYYISGNVTKKRSLKKKIKLNQNNEKLNKIVMGQLAESLQRPFHKGFYYRIFDENHMMGSLYLIFENLSIDILEFEFMEVLETLNPFIQEILKRIYVENEIKKASILWEKTFQQLLTPTVILDDSFNIVKSNLVFRKNINKRNKCYEAFANNSMPCKNCLITKKSNRGKIDINNLEYEVISKRIELLDSNKTYFINQYIEISRKKNLKIKVMQNEKINALGNMAGALAHEINNPLAGIHSLVQYLLTKIDNKSICYSDLKEVEKACLRCENIIKNLIDYTDSGTEKKKSEINVMSLIKDTLPLLKTTLKNHRIQIEEMNRGLTVRVNKSMLQQVIFNLVNNACQSMTNNGVLKITIEQSESYVIICFIDNGAGISEKNKEEIFSPFFTTKPLGQGTGLGLSISKKIIENENGKLYLDKNYSHGAKFVIHLPLLNSDKGLK